MIKKVHNFFSDFYESSICCGNFDDSFSNLGLLQLYFSFSGVIEHSKLNDFDI